MSNKILVTYASRTGFTAEIAQAIGKTLAESGAPVDVLCEMQARHPGMGDVRGRGLMLGVEFVQQRDTKEPARELRNQVIHRCFEHGLLTLGCGQSTIRFCPPLMIDKTLVDEGLEIFERALTQVEKT